MHHQPSQNLKIIKYACFSQSSTNKLSSKELINLTFTSLARNRELYKLQTFLLNSLVPFLVWSHQPVCVNFNFPFFSYVKMSGFINGHCSLHHPMHFFQIKQKHQICLPHHDGTGDKLQILKQNSSPIHS